MADIPEHVKQQAAAATMGAKDSLNVDALPSRDANSQDVWNGPSTPRGQLPGTGHNYNPADPVPERTPAPATPEQPSSPDAPDV